MWQLLVESPLLYCSTPGMVAGVQCPIAVPHACMGSAALGSFVSWEEVVIELPLLLSVDLILNRHDTTRRPFTAARTPLLEHELAG